MVFCEGVAVRCVPLFSGGGGYCHSAESVSVSKERKSGKRGDSRLIAICMKGLPSRPSGNHGSLYHLVRVPGIWSRLREQMKRDRSDSGERRLPFVVDCCCLARDVMTRPPLANGDAL